MVKETKVFQAEVKEILDLMIHSLYSTREIFIRELISNSSDALDRLRFEELKDSELKTTDEEKHIRISVDKEKNTISIADNGIGMSHDEVVENIGTIARSGTKRFIQKARELKENPELIGQFGVGFYSSFMVAKKVSLHTQKAGSDVATVWESSGDGTYSIQEAAPRDDGHGTTVTIFLRDQKEDDEAKLDFTDEWTIKSTVKKYSDFISFPIKMKVTTTEPKKDDKGEVIENETISVTKDETLNSQKALWLKPPAEISKDEYKEFYKHISYDWMEPLETIHFHAEGTSEFSALMFIPSVVPMDYNQREAKIGLNLYVKRVFILANCEDLLPTYMRFLKGVVDSSDLPLNVSREILQKDNRIVQIKKAIVSKVLKQFKTMLDKDRDNYVKFWEIFGPTLKEGIPSDYANKEKIEKICLFRSSAGDKFTTLDEYVSRMKEGQKDIYYISGESLVQLSSSPYLEKLKQKGYEVLYLTDPVDEFVVRTLQKYDDKAVVSITQENLDLDTEEEKKSKEQDLKDRTEKYKPLTEVIKKALEDSVKEVRLSDRLIDSPCCLVSSTDDPSAYMERMMEAVGQKMPKTKRIMEINPDHPLFEKMQKSNKEVQEIWSQILYNQALLNEGSTIENPTKFAKQIAELMVNANV